MLVATPVLGKRALHLPREESKSECGLTDGKERGDMRRGIIRLQNCVCMGGSREWGVSCGSYAASILSETLVKHAGW